MKILKLKIIPTLLATVLLLYIGCSHNRSNVESMDSPGYKGPLNPAGESLPLPTVESSSPAPSGGGVPPPPAGFACPTDGSYLVVDPYLPNAEKILGPLVDKENPQLGQYQDHAGGVIRDAQIYKESSTSYLLLNYGRTLVKKFYILNTALTQIGRPGSLAEIDLPAPIEKILQFSNGGKTWVVVATALHLYFYETRGSQGFTKMAKIPMPDSPTSLYFDEVKRDLYVATAESNVYQLNLSAIKGGCVYRVAKRDDFLGRAVKKMQVANGQLFVLSAKVVPPPAIDLDSVSNLLRPLGAFLQESVANLFESIWDPDSIKLDVLDLMKGVKTNVGQMALSDFFVDQNKLYLVASHLLNVAEASALKDNINTLLQTNCGSPDFHCPKGDASVIQYIMYALVGHVELAGSVLTQSIQEFQPLIDFHYKPAGLVIFNDLNHLITPSLVYRVQDPPLDPANPSNIDEFRSAFWNVKGLMVDGNIYLSGSRAIILLKPDAAGSFNQTTPYYQPPPPFSDLDANLRTGRQVLKIDYMKVGNDEAILRLRGLGVNRGLDSVVLANAQITEHRSHGLPSTILGKKGDIIYTSVDFADYARKIAAKWHMTDDDGAEISPPLNWLSYRDTFSSDPSTGYFTFLQLNDGGTPNDPTDDYYEMNIVNGQNNPVPLAAPLNLPRFKNERVNSGCTKTTERILKGVRSVGLADGSGATHFILFVEKYTFVGGAVCPGGGASFASLMIGSDFTSYNGGPVVNFINQSLINQGLTNPNKNLAELTRINLAQFDSYKAWFEGPAHRSATGDATYVFARSVDGLFLAKRFEDSTSPNANFQFIGKAVLAGRGLVANLVVSQGEGDSLIVAIKRNQFAQFYRYPLANILNQLSSPGAVVNRLGFARSDEIKYVLPLEPLYGDLASILTLDNDHCILRILSNQAGSRLELLKIDGDHFNRLTSTNSVELLDMGSDPADPKNIILATGNDGLEFFHVEFPP